MAKWCQPKTAEQLAAEAAPSQAAAEPVGQARALTAADPSTSARVVLDLLVSPGGAWTIDLQVLVDGRNLPVSLIRLKSCAFELFGATSATIGGDKVAPHPLCMSSNVWTFDLEQGEALSFDSPAGRVVSAGKRNIQVRNNDPTNPARVKVTLQGERGV